MFSMIYATLEHLEAYRQFDGHVPVNVLRRKLKEKECYLIQDDGVTVGVLRYSLFWDQIPFLSLIYLAQPYRGRGFGREAMLLWEEEMRLQGHPAVMTSTQVNEAAQHFYRKLGYRENGCLMLSQEPLRQPMEMFLIKWLERG